MVGTGGSASGGDGRQAREASVAQPRGAYAIAGGGIVWAEPRTHTVRLAGADGIVKTIAGAPGRPGRTGDGGPASKARLSTPNAAVSTSEGVLVVDTGNNRIRLVDEKDVIRTVAGIESAGYSGDGGPATAARLRSPTGIALVPGGGFLIADAGNHVVRRVFPDGRISTVAGTGRRGYSGDGGSATAAQLSFPWAVAAAADGAFLVADSGNQRIRRVAADGTISTVAGTGTRGYSGDGGPAMSALLADPRAVALSAGGAILVADTGNHRVRRIAPDGTISAFAGTGSAGFGGDGGLAGSAALSSPESVTVTTTGGALIADAGNNRIRLVGIATRPANVARPTIFGEAELGRTVAALAGGWRGTGPAISYRWQRCELDKPRCDVIRGATSEKYRVRLGDFGFLLRVAVTATNAAGQTTAFSAKVGVGRLERQTFLVDSGAFDGFVRGVLKPGSKPRVTVELARTSVEVFRRPLSGSRWETSVGVLLYDTRPLDDRLRLESATLFVRVLNVHSTGGARLLVHRCANATLTKASDFRAFPPRGALASLPLRKIRRGPTAVALPAVAIPLDAPTKLCLYISGRAPRTGNVIKFAALEGAKELSAVLLVAYRAR